MMPFLKSTSFVCYMLLNVKTTITKADDDVPGCACQADTTCGTDDTILYSNVAACAFTQLRSEPYNFTSVFGQPVPICDALEADPEFQETVGNENSTRYYQLSGGDQTIGPYYETGFFALTVTSGTCQDLYAEQNSCLAPQKVGESSKDFGTGIDWSVIEPLRCTQKRLTLPTTNSSLDGLRRKCYRRGGGDCGGDGVRWLLPHHSIPD